MPMCYPLPFPPGSNKCTYLHKNFNTCCPGFKCDDELDDLPKCEIKGQTFVAGQKFRDKDNFCQECICLENGQVECHSNHCDYNKDGKMIKGCVPLFKKGMCCPYDWVCPKTVSPLTPPPSPTTTTPSISSSVRCPPGVKPNKKYKDYLIPPKKDEFTNIAVIGAPAYLSVLGHEDCLDEYSPAPGHMEKCMPERRPRACIPPAWQKLQEVFDGIKCPEFPLWQNGPSLGIAAPEYLSVVGHEDCLDEYSPAPGRTEKCMPEERPQLCIPPAWDQLQEVFDGVRCPEFPLWQNGPSVSMAPPAYLAVVGHKDCLESYSASPNHREKCLPSTRPNGCIPPAWEKLLEVFEGERCPSLPVWQNNPSVGIAAPDYLSINGHEDCLGTYSPSPFYVEKCLPIDKPVDCDPQSWQDMMRLFKGEKCPEYQGWKNSPARVGLAAPEYLSIAGHQDCLDTYKPSPTYSAKCLPLSKPQDCSLTAWDQMQRLFVGETCPEYQGWKNSPARVGLAAPEYLSIVGHEDCLDEFSASPTHNEKCLPSEILNGCKPAVWKRLKEVFNGQTCPSLPVWQNSPSLGTPTPGYLTIPGHQECLDTYRPNPMYSAKCIPETRPAKCALPAWEQMKNVFDGEVCPKYPLWQDFTIPEGNPMPMPGQRSPFLSVKAGKGIQAAVTLPQQLGSGFRKPVGLRAPPYLSVVGHEDCLEEYSASPTHTEKCLPMRRPQRCLPPAFKKLEEVFEGGRCPSLPVWQNSPSLGMAPPEYLSVVGHEKCLDSYSPRPGHTEKCLPERRPRLCIKPVWDQLQEVFEGAKCPEFPLWQNGSPSLGIAAPEYLSVPGHEDCLDSFNPSSSFSTKCIPSIKPGKCSQRSWEELKSNRGSLKFCPNAGKFTLLLSFDEANYNFSLLFFKL